MRTPNLAVKLVLCSATAALFVVGLSFVAAVHAGATEESTGQGLQLIKSDAQSIVLELRTPAYDIEETTVEGTIYHVLSVPGYAQNDRVGHPQLPLEGTLLGIPPHAQVDLHVLEAEGDIIPGDYNLPPVPRLIAEYDPSSDLAVDAGTELVQDQSVYSVNSFYPADLARITSSGFIRDQRFLHVQLYPFQYNPVTRQLKFYQRVLVEISFSYPEGATLATGGGETGSPFEATLRNSILNYESARGWRERGTRPALLEASTMDAAEDRYKIAVSEEGIYQLDYADLEAAGVPVDPPGFVDPRNFHIYNRGEEIAIYVHGEEDGGFQLGDYVLFYGQPADTKYTNTNIYWFTAGGASGRRMEAESGEGVGTTATWFTATARLEEDQWYWGWLPFAEAEHWYWEYLQFTSQPVTKTYNINLSNIYAGEAYSATLRSEVWGGSADSAVDPDHHVIIYINDHEVENAWWDGQTGYPVDRDFSNSYLLEGPNEIKVVCPGDTGTGSEIVVTDWFEIDYRDTHVAENDSLKFTQEVTGTSWEYEISNFSWPSVEVYDITEPISVSRIVSATIVPVGPTYTLTFTQDIASPARYLALTGPQTKSPPGGMTKDSPSNLRDPSNGADYVVITHSDFYDNVLPLVDPDRPAVQGLRTTVVDVQDIYDEFSYGIFDPQAIRDFLAFAYGSWQPPAPSYVLLVGDGNYDPKDNLGRGEPNYIPPFLACVDPEYCEVATDNRYVCVNGPDIFPDMHIGRLPVKTAAEADAVISKILIYEQTPLADWRSQALFVADDPDPEAGNFPAISDDIADNHLPSSYSAEKVYYGVSPHTTPSDVTTAIIDGINEGRLLVHYSGHGAVQFWGGELFLVQDDYHRHDIDSLSNSPRFPVVLQMTCHTGNFIHPSAPGTDLSCLSESLVRAEAKGAVASWAPTGVGHAEGHQLLETGFFNAVFTDGVLQVGAAATQAKCSMDSYQYLIELYTLLGDPAMRLAVRRHTFLPLSFKGY